MTTTDIAIQKARYSTDIFTTEGEAKARSYLRWAGRIYAR